MIRFLLFLLFKFVLGAESGASFSWSAKWQSKKIYGFSLKHLPEIVDTLIVALMCMQGYKYAGCDFDFYIELGTFLIVSAITYSGIQSATWMFLQWEGHDNPSTDRKGTTKPIVDKIADRFGWSLGDEGYSWVAATVKGTIITLPMGGLGGLLFALGYEIGSHAKGRVDKWFNPHIISEGMSFVGIGIYSWLFLYSMKWIGGVS